MTLTTKILSTLIACTLTINAQELKVADFLKSALSKNPNISNVKVEVKATKKVKGLSDWEALNILIKADIKENGKIKPIAESTTYFTNGRFIANSLTDMKTGLQIKLEPTFLNEYYLDSKIISGSKDSKHKIVIFSDPLCGFCKKSIPKLLRITKKHPKQFAVYYYDYPIDTIHPASKTIIKINEKLREGKNTSQKLELVTEMYDFDINPRETNEEKILSSYNNEFGYKLTIKQINSKEILKSTKESLDIAAKMSIHGTPSVYFDGEKDDAISMYRQFLKK